MPVANDNPHRVLPADVARTQSEALVTLQRQTQTLKDAIRLAETITSNAKLTEQLREAPALINQIKQDHAAALQQHADALETFRAEAAQFPDAVERQDQTIAQLAAHAKILSALTEQVNELGTIITFPGSFPDPPAGDPSLTAQSDQVPQLTAGVVQTGSSTTYGTATQGGTAGSPATAYQWFFQLENNTNALGPFGSGFYPATVNLVTRTDWRFGYQIDSTNPGYISTGGAAYYAVLPDCGDTNAHQIQIVFNSPDGKTCTPYKFAGLLDGSDVGNWLFEVPTGGGAFTFGAQLAGGQIQPYMQFSGIISATPVVTIGQAGGVTQDMVQFHCYGATTLYESLTISGTSGVAGSSTVVFDATAAGGSQLLKLNINSGQTAILSFADNTNGENYRIYNSNIDLYFHDQANNLHLIQFGYAGVAGNLQLAVSAGTKLGFFSTSCVAQQNAVGSAAGYAAGTTAATFHSDDTYTGNTGSTAYTINGIVSALKKYGLLAS